MGRVLGHLAEVRDIAIASKKNYYMSIFLKKKEWYQVTGSKTFELSFLGKPVIISSDTNVNKEVLGSKQGSFTNSVPFRILIGHFFPTSMFVVDGDHWQRIRKVVQRAMSKQSLDPVVPVMCESAESFLNHPETNTCQTAEMMKRITFDGFHRVMYGWDPKSIIDSPDSVEMLQAGNILANAVGKRSMAPIPWLWKLPTKDNKEIDAATAFIKEFILNFVASRRAEIKKSGNGPSLSLLDSMILAADLGEDGGLTDQELFDQIGALFFGAYHTTSGTLHFLLHYLACYPTEQESLRAHLRARFPTRTALSRATLDEVEGIAPLCHFVDEVNRLHAVAPLFGRTALRDVEVAGRLVPAGAEFLIDSATIGRDPALWDGQTDLDAFRPARWAGRHPTGLAAPMPFGFGGRVCPGRRIALAEMRAFVAAVLLSHRVALRAPGEAMELDMLLGLNLSAGNGNVDFAPLP
jgi:cytochrome P450